MPTTRDAKQAYDSIIEAVLLAVDAEQTTSGDPHKLETEKCLHVVYVLLSEALGITPPDA